MNETALPESLRPFFQEYDFGALDPEQHAELIIAPSYAGCSGAMGKRASRSGSRQWERSGCPAGTSRSGASCSMWSRSPATQEAYGRIEAATSENTQYRKPNPVGCSKHAY